MSNNANDVRPLLAGMIRQAANALATLTEGLNEHAAWSPLGKGRSAMAQVLECASFCGIGTQVFTTFALPSLDPEARAQMLAPYDTPEKAVAFLRQTSESLAGAIAALPDERLTDTVTLPFGGGITKTYPELAALIYWNMAYHEGQINLLDQMVLDWKLPEGEKHIPAA